MLWDMVRYENYDETSPYNREAAAWAKNQKQFRLPIDNRPLRNKLAQKSAIDDLLPPINISLPASRPLAGKSPHGSSPFRAAPPPTAEVLFLGDFSRDDQEISWVGHGDLGTRAVSGLEALSRRGQEGLAGRRQPDLATGAVKEPRTELLLQSGDLMAERRLNDEAALCGAGEVADHPSAHPELARLLLRERVRAVAVAERREGGFAERDADILDRVVLVDIEIARCMERQVETAVAREQLQHVIEEPDAGGNLVSSTTVQGQSTADLSFGGPAIERGGARAHPGHGVGPDPT